MSHPDDLTIAERARARMADKARLPWWYVAAQTLGMLALLLQAPLTRLFPGIGEYGALGWPIAIVLIVGPLLLRQVRGVEAIRAPLGRYPSTRRLGIAFLVAAVIGVLVVNVLTRQHLIVAAIVVAVLLAAACGVYQVLENANVRRDIRDGRVVPR